MTFRVLDSVSVPGNPAKANEDAFGAEARAAVVMDGATGLGDNLMPGRSDAAWLATFGARRLMAYVRDGASAREAVAAALFDAQTSFEALRRRPPAETWEMPFSSMMLVAEAPRGIEALWFGDCAALVKRSDAAAEIVGDALDKREKEAQRVAKLSGKYGLTSASAANRPQFIESLRKGRNHANTVEGTWAFSPDVRAADHVNGKALEAPAGTIVLLCSDGFLALVSDYKAYDAEGLVAACQTKGLAKLVEELRAIEAKDADGIVFPRFKTSDDATALLIQLT